MKPTNEAISSNKTRVALYARVSTNGKGQDVNLQLKDLQEYAEARGWQVFQEYVDDGISGRKDSRPSLDCLMNDSKKKRFDVVAVWRFDRFARSTRHLVTALEEFRHLGIDFVSYRENIDTSSPMGKAMFTIASAFSELEADLIRERVTAGIANAKRKGKRIGRPRANVDKFKIHELKNGGLPIRAIAEQMGLSKSLVHKTLQNQHSQVVEKLGVGSQQIAVL